MNNVVKSSVNVFKLTIAVILGALGLTVILASFVVGGLDAYSQFAQLPLIVAISGSALFFIALNWGRQIRLQSRIEDQAATIKQSEDEKAGLRQVIDEYAHQQINITRFEAIAEIALMKFHCRFPDFLGGVFDSNQTTKTRVEKEGDHEYVGLIFREFDIKLGFDLASLRVARLSHNGIVIHGLFSKVIGFDNRVDDPQLREIRELKYLGGLIFSDPYLVVHPTHPFRDMYLDHQNATFESRFKESVDLASFNACVEKLAKELIKEIFRPSGLRVEFSQDEPTNGSESILKFIKRHNDEMLEKQSAAEA